MSRIFSRRLASQSPFSIIKEPTPTLKLLPRCVCPFSNSSKRRAEGDDNSSGAGSPSQAIPRLNPRPKSASRAAPLAPRSSSLNPKARTEPVGGLAALSNLFAIQQNDRDEKARSRATYDPSQSSIGENLFRSERERNELPHIFSVYATRHNTHITVSAPQQGKRLKEGEQQDRTQEGESMGYDVLISVSAGNLGFRKSARKHYDSAFQTAAYVMARMQERGWNNDIKKMEVRLRGFGAGREAVTKAILGSEGRFLRGKIVKVADNTRLKFGGTRSRKPRRLG